MFDWMLGFEGWVALLTLVMLEIVLGVDNIIFISILVSRLPAEQRDRARRIGLSLAMMTRILLLVSLVWVMSLVKPLFDFFDNPISGRDLILIVGGLFLLAKSTHEIHVSFEEPDEVNVPSGAPKLLSVLIQIAILDIVFSLDSVITAVGMVEHLSIMVLAVIASVMVMLVAAKPIGDFVDSHPSIKILALSFLMIVGVTLIAEGFDLHIPKGYIYFAMAFSFCVEIVNIRLRRKVNAKG